MENMYRAFCVNKILYKKNYILINKYLLWTPVRSYSLFVCPLCISRIKEWLYLPDLPTKSESEAKYRFNVGSVKWVSYFPEAPQASILHRTIPSLTATRKMLLLEWNPRKWASSPILNKEKCFTYFQH